MVKNPKVRVVKSLGNWKCMNPFEKALFLAYKMDFPDDVFSVIEKDIHSFVEANVKRYNNNFEKATDEFSLKVFSDNYYNALKLWGHNDYSNNKKKFNRWNNQIQDVVNQKTEDLFDDDECVIVYMEG